MMNEKKVRIALISKQHSQTSQGPMPSQGLHWHVTPREPQTAGMMRNQRRTYCWKKS